MLPTTSPESIVALLIIAVALTSPAVFRFVHRQVFSVLFDLASGILAFVSLVARFLRRAIWISRGETPDAVPRSRPN